MWLLFKYSNNNQINVANILQFFEKHWLKYSSDKSRNCSAGQLIDGLSSQVMPITTLEKKHLLRLQISGLS